MSDQVVVVMFFERSTKHSHLYKAGDGSNTYIQKSNLPTPPPKEVKVVMGPSEDE